MCNTHLTMVFIVLLIESTDKGTMWVFNKGHFLNQYICKQSLIELDSSLASNWNSVLNTVYIQLWKLNNWRGPAPQAVIWQYALCKWTFFLFLFLNKTQPLAGRTVRNALNRPWCWFFSLLCRFWQLLCSTSSAPQALSSFSPIKTCICWRKSISNCIMLCVIGVGELFYCSD